MDVDQRAGARDAASKLAWLRGFVAADVSDADRPIRLKLGRGGALAFDGLLVAQRIEIDEVLCGGLAMRVHCLAADAGLPPEGFLGLPIEVQLVTDRRQLRRFCGIVTAAGGAQSDGGFASYELTAADALSVIDRRRNTRVFRTKSVAEITELLLGEWLQRSPGLAVAFDFDLSRVDRRRHPPREFTMQLNESDAGFLRRLWRRAGIGWAIRPAEDRASPMHQLLLFDDSMRLPVNAAGAVRYHRDAAAETRDAITQWLPWRGLVPGRVRRCSWDYKPAQAVVSHEGTILDQGEAGAQLAAALQDGAVEMPHAGNDADDHQRLTRLRMQRHEIDGSRVDGRSGVRDLAAGEWITVQGHAAPRHATMQDHEYLMVEVHHLGENNLPKPFGAAPLGRDDLVLEPDRRYVNRFVAVRRDVPVVPSWDPCDDLPPTPPLTALVVGPAGEEVHCDAMGRVKIRFIGLDPDDHAHAAGAGTSGSDRDSAWVRVDFGWAGAGYGHFHPLRVGMEVVVQFLGGDPDRPLITGLVYNGLARPPDLGRAGLPANRYLSGTKTQEIAGRRANQLRYDDTPGQISVQLASDHAASQLNLGFLGHPRSDGRSEPRGEGFELRSDEHGAIRGARGLLISAWQRLGASDGQLARDETLGLMQQCLDLFRTLGRYAAAHQGLSADDAASADLLQTLTGWEDGSNTRSRAERPEKPAAISLSAPHGVALTTAESVLQYAGLNSDTVAQQHLQMTAGQRATVNAGQGIGLFAHDGGIRAIAHQGKLQLQSQHGGTAIDSAQDMQLRAVGDLMLVGKTITLVAEDGSFVKIGGGVTSGTEGTIAGHAASFTHGGPQTLAAAPPSFAKGRPDTQFVLLFDPQDPQSAVVANRRFRMRLNDGSVVEGRSDAQGRTSLAGREAMHIAEIEIYEPD